ncbi:MAG TPA: hypothetical protein P5555_18220 [Candidatus Paceibacterota bacterium]|nr:hypothetical protein [Verrucomicrobiota bacterium]HOX03441.1 hypothetical protein [Verrucomicrobiota bacterium]HRZ47119.1 hypothetical protein [Candidatus Paceibacterota bacterium]HRZ93300.1 hypothetical protein [Candidatus Paceibacterota bacterium]
MSLVASNYGLPEPEALSLVSLVRADDGNPATSEDLFDPARLTGGEHWQGVRIRINGLTLLNAENWSPTNAWASRLCTVTDGENRFFKIRHPRYSLGPAPASPFDAIGILNQESGSGVQGTNGYELFVQAIEPSSTPRIDIASAPVITWPGSLANYALVYTNLAGGPGPWQAATNVPVLVNGRWTVILDPSEARTRFYTLQRCQ